MTESNELKVDEEKFKQIIRQEYNIESDNIDIKFPNDDNIFVKITYTSMIKDLENTRVIRLTETDIKNIFDKYLSGSDFICKNITILHSINNAENYTIVVSITKPIVDSRELAEGISITDTKKSM